MGAPPPPPPLQLSLGHARVEKVTLTPHGLCLRHPQFRRLQLGELIVSLVVNVASECGFTEEHYRALQQLQRDLGPHHFNVLAFPCNQFGQQEPDSNKEIESFARRTYSVSFPMFSKVAVTGTGAHPAFKYLTQTSGKEPTWNFWKYLVAPDGKVVGAWDPTVSVEEIRPQITALVRKLILKKREDL
ncbi:PREDICTED: glutathione peroxidase 7 [Myotis brandtii]|uniref:glutathione peroxidase 7 n=1 Tax=Myotis brandtii TaxID=109478 RepID=UPI000703D363|nr:PREDICTED: glutathione peroxidase 7 [Myotis brandtii]